MIKLTNLKITASKGENALWDTVISQTGAKEITDRQILRKSVDAHKKSDVNLVYTVCFSAKNEKDILKKSKLALAVFGVFSGIIFSLLMDGWTVLWAEGTFSASRYLAFVVSALPVTAIYAVSNVLFLLVLAVPIGGKLDRVIKKYGI